MREQRDRGDSLWTWTEKRVQWTVSRARRKMMKNKANGPAGLSGD